MQQKASNPAFQIPAPLKRPGEVDWAAEWAKLYGPTEPTIDDMCAEPADSPPSCKAFEAAALASCGWGPDPDLPDLEIDRIDYTALQCGDVKIASDVCSEASEKKPLHIAPVGTDLAAALTMELRARIHRRYHDALVGLRVELAGDQARIICACQPQRDILDRLSDALSAALSALCLPTQAQLVYVAPAAPSVAEDIQVGRPAWIAAEVWATLSPALRPHLRGTTVEDGRLVGLTPFAERQLQRFHGEALAALLAGRIEQ